MRASSNSYSKQYNQLQLLADSSAVCGMISKLVKKHDLPWLRFKMANSRYANHGELLEADLPSEVMAGIKDGNMVDEPCNCNAKSLREDKTCLNGGKCRKKMIIYGLKDRNTRKTYYGKTIQHLKIRTQQHFSDIWKIIDSKLNPNDMEKKNKAMATDFFADHFAQICGNCTNSKNVIR